jgi:tetratricopeptide (TPR) repeat protein
MTNAPSLRKYAATGLVAFCVTAAPFRASAQAPTPPCAANQQRLEGLCIDQAVVNFVKCLERLSGGKLSTKTYEKAIGDVGIKLADKGGGASVRREGEVKVDNRNLNDLVVSAEATFDTNLVGSCKTLARRTPVSTGQTLMEKAQQLCRLGADFESNSPEAALAAYQISYDVSERKLSEAGARLGLVELRLNQHEQAVEHLQRALDDRKDLYVREHRTWLENALKRARASREATRAEATAPMAAESTIEVKPADSTALLPKPDETKAVKVEAGALAETSTSPCSPGLIRRNGVCVHETNLFRRPLPWFVAAGLVAASSLATWYFATAASHRSMDAGCPNTPARDCEGDAAQVNRYNTLSKVTLGAALLSGGVGVFFAFSHD